MKTAVELLSRAKDSMNIKNPADGQRLLLLLILEVLLDIRDAGNRLLLSDD